MNPTQVVEQEYTGIEYVTVDVESTDWFNAAKKEPGQPGVFEVNPVEQFENEPAPRRFSFFNGKAYGPIEPTPEAAYSSRFGKSGLSNTITAFRGLSEPA